MKRRFILPLVILLFLSLACQVKLNLTPTPPVIATAVPLIVQPTAEMPTESPTEITTEAPAEFITEAPTETLETAAPTEVEAATLETAAPTEAPTEAATEEECPFIFEEEFEGTVPDCWTIYNVTGGTNADTTKITFANGALRFKYDMERGNTREETYIYAFYDRYDYGNVVFTTSVSNYGVNKNGIALVCGITKSGWYESRITSGGELKMYSYDAAVKAKGGNPYTELYSGGISTIRVGEGRENILKLACKDGSMTLTVNDKDIKTVTLKGYQGGGIGVGVMAYANTGPVLVEFNDIKIK